MLEALEKAAASEEAAATARAAAAAAQAALDNYYQGLQGPLMTSELTPSSPNPSGKIYALLITCSIVLFDLQWIPRIQIWPWTIA